MPRAAVWRQTEQLLAHDLPAAAGADGGVGGRRVKPDRCRGLAGEISGGS
jgi:hypothetical protein